MGVIRSLINFVGGGGVSRNKGQQSSSPGSYPVASAVNVTLDSAMQLSAVWACVRLITETIGSMPIVIYDVAADGTKTKNINHPLNKLLNGKMNKWQTRQEFIETLTYQYVLQGNAYSVKQRNSKGEIIALVPLMTPQMEVDLQDSGEVLYHYTEGSGRRIYAQETVWHNKLFGNGIIGLSPLAYARNSIGVGQAAEQATTNIYKNGGKPSGLLMLDKVLKPDQRKKIKENFEEMTSGTSDRLFVLEADMKFESVSLSPTDIELLSSRRFQIEDICRFFGVPSILVNDTQASTAWGSGIAQIVQGFYKFGLRPYLARYEASMNVNLLEVKERGKISIEFDLSQFLEPTYAERVKSGKESVTGGLISPNEWRAKEQLPAKEGADCLIVQQQMVPIETIKTTMTEE